MFKLDYIQRYAGVMVLSSLFLITPAHSLAEIENSEVVKNIEKTNKQSSEWEYVFEDRPDPFLPFIQPTVATTNIAEVEEEVILTGMQLFEPGQLKLVAIMFSPDKKLAMVEDVTGKGYIINEGTLIGRYGVISQISMNQVNITETRRVAGKDVVTPVVMRLDKEGDQ